METKGTCPGDFKGSVASCFPFPPSTRKNAHSKEPAALKEAAEGKKKIFPGQELPAPCIDTKFYYVWTAWTHAAISATLLSHLKT